MAQAPVELFVQLERAIDVIGIEMVKPFVARDDFGAGVDANVEIGGVSLDHPLVLHARPKIVGHPQPVDEGSIRGEQGLFVDRVAHPHRVRIFERPELVFQEEIRRVRGAPWHEGARGELALLPLLDSHDQRHAHGIVGLANVDLDPRRSVPVLRVKILGPAAHERNGQRRDFAPARDMGITEQCVIVEAPPFDAHRGDDAPWQHREPNGHPLAEGLSGHRDPSIPPRFEQLA